MNELIGFFRFHMVNTFAVAAASYIRASLFNFYELFLLLLLDRIVITLYFYSRVRIRPNHTSTRK